jgi:predicted Ser/Thr protein kinase
MGVVYRAYDTRLEREVAIKILTATALTDQTRQRLLREARAVARLSHPNIIPVFDAGEAQVPGHEHPLPYIVMEYVEGVSLHDHQPEGLAETIKIVVQVSDALEHAHKQGVVHRDLKPENILITSDGRAMLMDFGLASAGASRLTTEGTILGTVFYLAPELAVGKEYDGRADLYALGVLLYELTTGQLPFSAEDPVAVIGQHLHATATPPRSLNPTIPEALNDLILQMLNKEPGGRPASAGDVKETLKGLRESSPPPEMRARAQLPAFLKDVDQKLTKTSIFVARERELARLEQFLEATLSGQGGIAFITGGPGSGKSALMEAFSRRTQGHYPELVAASGKCNAYTGTGDPYSPFREVLGDLTGDVEAKWAAGTISTDQATRLWKIMPATAQVLVDHAPDLVDVFTSGKGLISRLSKAAPEQEALLQSLRMLTDGVGPTPGELEQKALFEQYMEVLCHLSSKRPILILLDDLQWADSASLNLLFHLGRELSGGSILLLGAYRPEEVALGRGGGRHPLEEVLAEFKRLYGDVWIDLSAESPDEGRNFVD